MFLCLFKKSPLVEKSVINGQILNLLLEESLVMNMEYCSVHYISAFENTHV